MAYLKVSEVAARLRVSKSTVNRLVRAGLLPATQISTNNRRIDENDLYDYIRNNLIVPTDR